MLPGGEPMPLCRLSIQTDDEDTSMIVDVALPTTTAVGVLLPTVVGLTGLPESGATEARRWRLHRSSGTAIDESMTLTENGVRDGDLLLLTSSDVSPPVPAEWDTCQAVSRPTRRGTVPFLGEAGCAWAVAAAAAVLVWTGVTADRLTHLIVALAATAVTAVMARRRPVLAVAAVTMGGASGFLVVPAGPAAPNVFLAAVSAASVAVLQMWWANRSSVSLTAMATSSLVAAISTAGPTVTSVPLATIGATMVTTSLGVLAVSARGAVALAGARPRFGEDVTIGAARAHDVLSGLVAGSAGGVALGSVLVAAACQRGDTDPGRGALFTAVVGLVLLLRVRTHVDVVRRAALMACGLAATSAGVMIAADASPANATWWAGALVAAALASVHGRGFGVVVTRAVDVAEYVALALVIPLACWMCGVYEVARGWAS